MLLKEYGTGRESNIIIISTETAICTVIESLCLLACVSLPAP